MAGALNSSPDRGDDPAGLDRNDRWVKITLLLGSLITLAFLVAAAVRENFLTPWRYHQQTYREMLLNSPDERQRKFGEAFEVEIRQVDLPQFGTTDRCVCCHVGIDNPAMADAEQPYRFHPGDYLEHHPVADYGCTICHRGQGAATNFYEAKATDVHWDYPLLPAKLTEASCGTCHAADSPLMVEHAPLLAHGREMFVDRGCQSCHKLDGVGGQLGPALDGVGEKIRHQLPMAHVEGEHTLVNWLTQHFDDPQAVVPGSKMRPPRLTAKENDALTAYMLSLSNLDLPRTYIPADLIVAQANEIRNKETDPAVLFHRFCTNCHGDGTYSRWDPFFTRFTPAVRGPGLRGIADEAYLRAAIEKGRPGTLMPAWGKSAGGLTDEQIDALVDYLSQGDERAAIKPKPVPEWTGGDVGRGGELFTQVCAGCHGQNELAPTLSNPTFLATADDELIAQTIMHGRPDTAMPAFQRKEAAGLTDEEVRDLVAFIRSFDRRTKVGTASAKAE